MIRFAPTIPIATLSGGDPELSISNDDWKRIELTYGHAVSTTAREQIYGATLTFLFFVEGEQTARPVSEARDRILQLKGAALLFQKAVFDNPPDGVRVSRIYADELVKRYFEDPRWADPQGLRSLELVMSSLMVACKQALTDLENPKNHGRRKGEAWRNWVCRVTDIIDAHQLPIEVRKDTDKNATGKPSPFVALIRELQAFIPQACRQSTHSDIALSEAIARARRSRRVTKASVARRNKTRQLRNHPLKTRPRPH
jgi:hypothetical protein